VTFSELKWYSYRQNNTNTLLIQGKTLNATFNSYILQSVFHDFHATQHGALPNIFLSKQYRRPIGTRGFVDCQGCQREQNGGEFEIVKVIGSLKKAKYPLSDDLYLIKSRLSEHVIT
jgi:hypothetical protein